MDIPKFNFKFKPVKPKRTNTNSFKRKSNKLYKGLCVFEDGEYKCRVDIDEEPNTLVLPFTERSYSLKYRKEIFTKALDEHGRHVHITRDDSSKYFDLNHDIYMPFMKNWIIKGYIVTENGKLYFDFVDLVNIRGHQPQPHYD